MEDVNYGRVRDYAVDYIQIRPEFVTVDTDEALETVVERRVRGVE